MDIYYVTQENIVLRINNIRIFFITYLTQASICNISTKDNISENYFILVIKKIFSAIITFQKKRRFH